MSDLSENLIFDIATAYRKTAALIAAVKLDVFTVIGSGAMSAADIAQRTGAAERGLRILCDYLTVIGLLKKQQSRYALMPVAATLLDRASRFAMGDVVDFLAAPETLELFLRDPVAYVRHGGSDGLAHLLPDNPIWVRFAKAMMPFAATTAKRVAAYVATLPAPPFTALDLAAGHGLYGIEIAKALPEVLITAVDWAEVLAVATANAKAANVVDRFTMLPGNALDMDWGSDFDLILFPNFLHHFDFETCTALLRKVKASLTAGGLALSVDFVPDESRIAPPIEAAFAFQMLASTPAGDAYTASELDEMARKAGFRGASVRRLSPIPESLIIYDAS